MKPLYYAAPGEQLVWASEIKAVLADPDVSRRVNPRGIAQFFTFGHFLGEDTLLEAVRVLPAAGWLTYEPASTAGWTWIVTGGSNPGRDPEGVARPRSWTGSTRRSSARSTAASRGAGAGDLALRRARLPDDPRRRSITTGCR